MSLPRSVPVFVGGVSVLAALGLGALALLDDRAPDRPWLVLALGGVLFVEHFFEVGVRRESGQRESYGHEESFLVAMALLSSPLTVAVAFGAAVLAGNAVLRRREPLKALFNVAAMLLSAAAALLVVVAVAGDRPAGVLGASAVVAGSAAFFVVNNASVSGVLALARAAVFRRNLVDDLPARLLVWAGNTATGLLAGLAAAAHLWTLPFGLVAMFALHFAFSGHARARAEQQKVADIVASSSDGIFSVDGRGRIVSWSPACEAITGYAAAEAIGTTLSELLALLGIDSDPDPARDPREPELVQARTRDGEARWLAVTRAPLPREGHVVVLRDETTRRQVDELMARQERERAQADLVAAVSHELRTPLTSIAGFTQTLLVHEVDERDRRRYLAIVQKEAQRLGALIDDLLDLRRLAEGRLMIVGEPIDLGEVLAQQVELFSGQSRAHSLALQLPPEPLRVSAQRDRLRQVVANLLSNAIKYSPGGGEVTVSAHAAGGVVRVEIADRGLGIPAELQADVFTRFFRIESLDRGDIRGTGLGLALAREIVEAHGGRMGFESREGEGSTFWFELPAA